MGGDLQGVNQKIKQGYFDDLGINAIWLSPISENPAGAFGFWNKGVTTKFSGYHGYWPTSYAKVDARFGTNQGFQSLITTAHEKQYNVILDFVAHHIHTDHPLYKQHPEWVTPLYLPDGSMNTERWDDYRLTTWFDTFLPTLLMEKEAVREVVSDSVLFWMKNFEIDGFRHDASKHVPEDFWRLLTKKIKRIQVEKKRNNFFQIGETYGSPALIGSYVNSGEMDGQFDFNLYDAAVNAFAANGDAAKDFKQLALTLNQSTSTYGNHHLMGNITGNQDKPRFISLADGSVSNAGDTKLQGWTNNIQNKGDLGFDKLAQMMAFNLTVPGVPVIYYGDEIGLPGANDPDNRRMMQFSNLNENQLKMKEITKQLIDFRRNKLELIYGELTILPIHENVFAFERNYFGKKTIIIFSKTKQTINFPMSDALTWTSQLEHQLTKDKKSITLSLKANDFEIISNY
jgi:glycosidase